MKSIGYLTVTMLVLFISYLWKGFVLCSLWKWFIVITFGVNPISIPQAIGLGLMIGLLTNHSTPKKDDRKFGELLASSFFSEISYYSLVLFIGWIVTFFIG